MIFIDGDFDSKKGDCPFHCYPTCHPAQVGPENVYGCRHPAWPSNQMGDHVPIVDCGGKQDNCDLSTTKFLNRWRAGLRRRIKNNNRKVDEWSDLLKRSENLKSTEGRSRHGARREDDALR